MTDGDWKLVLPIEELDSLELEADTGEFDDFLDDENDLSDA